MEIFTEDTKKNMRANFVFFVVFKINNFKSHIPQSLVHNPK